MNVINVTPEMRARFNHFMAHGPKGHILQSYEWGEIKAKTGWAPIRLLVENNGRDVAGITILKRKLPGLNRSIFYAPRGPVIDFSDGGTFDFLLTHIRQLAKEHRAILFKIDPDIPASNKQVVEFLRKRGFRNSDKGENFEGVQPKFVFRLPLDKPLAEIFAGFESKTRYNIRLAARKGVTIVEDCTKEHLKIFYEILKVTAERDRFLIRSYSYFEDMWDYLVERGYAKLFMAKYEGQFISGTLAFIFGDKAWYIYGASSNEHRNVMPNYALQWRMIEWAYQQGCTLYDFRGVSGDLNPENPLYGLYRFKKGFNGEFTEFIGEFDLVYSPLFYFLWDKVVPFYREIRGRLLAKRRSAQAETSTPAADSPASTPDPS